MSLLLRTSSSLPDAEAFDRWIAVAGANPALDPGQKVADVAIRLEDAFFRALADWRKLAPHLARQSGANDAHTPMGASNASDFGEMLAWSELIDGLADQPDRILIVCDDPWLFRHLAAREWVVAGPAPSIAVVELKLAIRGFLARLAVAIRVGRSLLSTGDRARFPRSATCIVVYGHPGSTPDGHDGYFGGLMAEVPQIVRQFHVDYVDVTARGLASGPRNFSLHAWGDFAQVLTLPFRRWRGDDATMLLRRARVREGGTGQAAMIAWQRICQRRWLTETRPRVVAWPWENHGWERDLVRTCRALGIATVGYQHATVGRYETNYALDCNADGMSSIPDIIVTSGPAGKAALSALGYPGKRLRIGGALRYAAPAEPRYDPAAPILVALPFDGRVAREIMAAIRPIALAGRPMLVKDHPMTPFAFEESAMLRRTDISFERHDALAGVVYAGTTVGLEARLARLPTFRFLPERCLVNDIIPEGIDVTTVTADTLADAVANARVPSPVAREGVFSRPDLTVWRDVLGCERAMMTI